MKEIEKIVAAYEKAQAANQQTALATVVEVEGSSYRRTGARMLIVEDGTWVGGISGGCLEGDALRKAKSAIMQQKPTLVTYDTREDDQHQIGVGLGCNGLIKVLVAPIRKETYHPIQVLKSCSTSRTVQLLITIALASHHKDLMGTMFTNLGEMSIALNHPELIKMLETDVAIAKQKCRSATVSYQIAEQEWTFFIEILPPSIHLVLYGGNYDVYPLAQLAKSLGWRVTIVTNLQKAPKMFFEVSDALVSKQEGLSSFDDFSAIVLMAHDYNTDKANLSQLLPMSIPYLGVLGPKKRTEKMLKELMEEGIAITDDMLSRLYAPIGLDTGAISPEEIAIAILAEIRTCFSGRNGGFLKYRQSPIHERAAD